MKLIYLLPFLFLFILISSIPGYAYYDINATDDSYVYNSSANTNYGSQTSISIENLAGSLMHTFIAFDLSSIPANETITSATLYLYNFGGAKPTADGYPMHNDTRVLVYNTTYFNESNITWNNQPTKDILQDNKTNPYNYVIGYQNFSVLDAVMTSYTSSDVVYFYLKYDNETRTTSGWNRWTWYSKEAVWYPFLRIETVSGSGCSGYEDGAWCDSYDLRLPCCYSDTIGDYITLSPPGCTFDTSNCYDLYGEIPNQINDLAPGFTVYNSSLDDCIQEYSSCPAGYVCNQFWNDDISQFEGKVSCYGTSTGDWIYYNESGDTFNGTEYILNNTVCDTFNSWIYNNSWTCTINHCQWCPLSLTCVGADADCDSLVVSPNCTNTTTICYNSYCNIVACTTNSVQSWGNSFNQSMGTPIATNIVAFVLALGISLVIFLKSKTKRLETFIIPFLSILGFFSLPGIEFFPWWFLLVEVLLVVMMVFFKVR